MDTATGEGALSLLSKLNVKLFADGADREEMLRMHDHPFICGFTTNPTLMRKAGITDYEAFARDILSTIRDYPISFEVFSDEFDEMEAQANKICQWGPNVYVKIPVTNTKGKSSAKLLRSLSKRGVKLNVTALLTLDQVREVVDAIHDCPAGYVSVFAGRIADTGRDPVPVMCEAVRTLAPYKQLELIWASPRELFNIVQADQVGCHIVTATRDILGKLPLIGKDLNEYSLETVKMFREDAVHAGFSL